MYTSYQSLPDIPCLNLATDGLHVAMDLMFYSITGCPVTVKHIKRQ